MQKRTQDLINQIPKSTWRELITPKQARAIFSKGHIHPNRTFDQLEWWNYIIVDTDNKTHHVQLVFLGPGDKRNSLYCHDCQGLCGCVVVAMIHFISKLPPLSHDELCEGCGKVLN